MKRSGPPARRPSRIYHFPARNLYLGNKRTSLRLEPIMWEALEEICKSEHLSIHDLVTKIANLPYPGGLSSAVRSYIVEYYFARARDANYRARIYDEEPPNSGAVQA